MKNFLRYWLPVLIWMFVIFGASGDAKSVQHTDSLLGRLLGWMHIRVTAAQLESLRWLVRKGAHMTEYAVLALLSLRALQARRPIVAWSAKAAGLALAVCIAYAASDEYHQSFVKDRTPSATDVLLDTAGASIALGMAWVVQMRRPQQPPAQ